MALLINQSPVRITRTASVDLSGSLNRFVVLTTTGQVALPGAAGALAVGVLDDLGPGGGVSGSNVSLTIFGPAKLEANAAFNQGVPLGVAATTGRARVGVTNDYDCALSLEAAGAQGDIVTVFIRANGRVP